MGPSFGGFDTAQSCPTLALTLRIAGIHYRLSTSQPACSYLEPDCRPLPGFSAGNDRLDPNLEAKASMAPSRIQLEFPRQKPPY